MAALITSKEERDPVGITMAGRFQAIKTMSAGAVVAAAIALMITAVLPPARASASASQAMVQVGTAPHVPQSALRLATVPAGQNIHLLVLLSPRNPAALSAFAKDVSTPGNPLFHHYLPRGAFGARFGATPATLSAVRNALEQLGLSPGKPWSNGLGIPITTTASKAEAAFRTTLKSYRLQSGRVAFANATAPLLPEVLAKNIHTIVGLDTIARLHPLGASATHGAVPPARLTASPAPLASGPTPCASAVNTGAYTANKLASAYRINSLYQSNYTGAGQTIALFELADFSMSDVSVYQSCYHLSEPITKIPEAGGGSIGSGTLEATSDVEDAIGLAPGASIRVYEAPNSIVGDLANWNAIVTQDIAEIASTSWGMCEQNAQGLGLVSGENTLFQEAATHGQTIVDAVGDFGSEACYNANSPGSTSQLAVQDPASQPYATGVGGTKLLSVGPPPNETVWNGTYGAGGGGVSMRWPMPSWQKGPGVIEQGLSSSTPCNAPAGQYCREVPDVSALASASPGYAFYCTAGDCVQNGTPIDWGNFYGTSFATPLWAAMLADINQSCTTPLGFINPAIYKAAASPATDPFNDVTTGNNDFTGTNGGYYPAGVGYDMASGLGTPNAQLLQKALGCPQNGYWFVASDGGIFSFGNASFYGSMGAKHLNKPIVGMAADPATGGYWFVASDGGIFSFDASFYGSMGAKHLNAPIVGMAATPDGKGYWFVASDGGIFSFGDAKFYGSMGAKPLNAPIVGMAATPDGKGYWFVASDGGIFSFGDAKFYGSMGGKHLNAPIVGMAARPAGKGYWFVASDGGIFSFGDAKFYGSMGGKPLNKPIVGMAVS